jgi:hypothetical protein
MGDGASPLLFTQGEDFDGGDLTFYDDVGNGTIMGHRPRMASMSVEPTRGRVVLFTSGWENIHSVHTHIQ